MSTFLVCSASLIAFSGYCALLIDWVQDIRAGIYRTHFTEAILETTSLLLYTYLAVRFLLTRIDLTVPNAESSSASAPLDA